MIHFSFESNKSQLSGVASEIRFTSQRNSTMSWLHFPEDKFNEGKLKNKHQIQYVSLLSGEIHECAWHQLITKKKSNTTTLWPSRYLDNKIKISALVLGGRGVAGSTRPPDRPHKIWSDKVCHLREWMSQIELSVRFDSISICWATGEGQWMEVFFLDRAAI